MPEPGPNKPGIKPGDKIALFVFDLSGGGAERVTLDLARGFLDRGFKCELILYRFAGSYIDQIPEGLKVVDLKASRTLSAFLPLTRHLVRSRPKVFISSLIHTNIIASWAARASRTKPHLILTFHNMTSEELVRYDCSPFSGLTSWLAHRAYSRAHNLVAVSQGVARDLENVAHLEEGSVKTIYNPCDLEMIRTKAKIDPGHPWFGPDRPPVILALGRMVEQKDFPNLIKGVSILRQDRRVRLMILGEGLQKDSLTSLAHELGLGDDFAAPGFKANPFSYMAGASVVALTSTFEGFGLVLVEAMCLGTPVVATNCPFGPSEILSGGKYGELVPIGDPQALAQALARTLDNPPPPQRLIARAEDFSMEKVIDRYQSLFMDSQC